MDEISSINLNKLYSELISQEIQSPVQKRRNFLRRKEIQKIFKRTNYMERTVIFSGLSTFSELQSNLYRLEELIIISLALENGKKKLQKDDIQKLFWEIGESYCSLLEDPAEDAFVSLVLFQGKNYRVFEGLWEGGAYYLQRFLETVETMPELEPFDGLKKNITTLLRISEFIAEKNRLERYTFGNEYPLNEIPSHLLRKNITERIMITSEEMKALEIDENTLTPFLFSLKHREGLLEEDWGNTSLLYRPLAHYRGDYYLLLPSAITMTIRKYIIISLMEINGLKSFEGYYAGILANHFRNMFFLGEIKNLPIVFHYDARSQSYYAEVATEILNGRYLHLLFQLDESPKEKINWAVFQPKNRRVEKYIDEKIDKSYEHFSNEEGFKSLLSITVSCEYGIGKAFSLKKSQRDNLHIIEIPSYDFSTLFQCSTINPLQFWRLFEAQKRLKELGGEITNINGFLNFYAYVWSSNYNLVDHTQMRMSEENSENKKIEITILSNYVRELRQKVLLDIDQHLRTGPDKRSVIVTKNPGYIFKQEVDAPLYFSFTDLKEHNLLRAVYVGKRCDWWCTVLAKETSEKEKIWAMFRCALHWLRKAVPVLERKYPLHSLKKVIWNLGFASFDLDPAFANLPSYEETKKCVFFNFTNFANDVYFDKSFFKAFQQIENIAERALLYSLVRGFMALNGFDKSDEIIEPILNEIITDTYEKDFHIWKDQNFIQRLQETLPPPIYIDELDEATLCLGLGWIDDKRQYYYSEIKNCTNFLSKVIDQIWRNIKFLLKNYNRYELIKKLLLNLDSLRKENQYWEKAFKPLQSQHNDHEDLFDRTINEQSKRDRAIITSRIILEMAVCTSQIEGGIYPDEMEIAQLLALALFMVQWGGASDAIHYELAPAEIHISYFGSILMNFDHMEKIVVPYSKRFQSAKFQTVAEDFPQYMRVPEYNPDNIENKFDADFNTAWREEYGFSVDNFRHFIDYLEDIALEENRSVISRTYQELINATVAGLSSPLIKNILNAFTLKPRDRWDEITKVINHKDWSPWKYGRKLSAATKPFIQIDHANNPTILVAPAQIRESFCYVFGNAHNADFSEVFFLSEEMKKWIGHKRNIKGQKFNDEVAKEITSIDGWKTETEITLPKLLGRKMDKNYGDIDVLAVNINESRVLAIECKNLEFAKNYSEVASQLYEFRGKNNRKNKSDRLKKHLIRVSKLNETENKNLIIKKYGLDREKCLRIEVFLIFSQFVPMEYLESIQNDVHLSTIKTIRKELEDTP